MDGPFEPSGFEPTREQRLILQGLGDIPPDPDGERHAEQNYRKGYAQGFDAALRLARQGHGMEKLQAHCNELMDWRYHQGEYANDPNVIVLPPEL